MIGNGGKAVEVTPEGGLAYWVINKTGAPSVRGNLLNINATIDNAMDLLAVDIPAPSAIVYDVGVEDGKLMRVVFSGKAHVLFAGSTTRSYFARMTVAADTGSAPGIAIAEPLPTPPFATDKHFMEIGHVLESRTGAGLALVNLHFN